MNEAYQPHSGILWHGALAISLAVTVLLVFFTASVWSRTEFVETIRVPKNPESLPHGNFFSTDKIEWIEVPARPFRTMLSATLSPLGICLLLALAVAAWISRHNRRTRRAVAFMAFLFLDRIIVLIFCVRGMLSRWSN